MGRNCIRQHLAGQLGLATMPRPHHWQYLPLPDIEGLECLECLIHPWIAPTSVSSHDSSTACTRGMCTKGCRSNTFHRHAEKNSSMGFRNSDGWRYCTRNGGWSTNKFWTGAAWWKLMLSHTTLYRFLWWSASFILVYAVLYGSRLAWLWRTPCVLEMAAHSVMFPPHWPGTSIMALWPMTFFPLLMIFARLNPAWSIKMNSCRIAWASWVKW